MKPSVWTTNVQNIMSSLSGFLHQHEPPLLIGAITGGAITGGRSLILIAGAILTLLVSSYLFLSYSTSSSFNFFSDSPLLITNPLALIWGSIAFFDLKCLTLSSFINTIGSGSCTSPSYNWYCPHAYVFSYLEIQPYLRGSAYYYHHHQLVDCLLHCPH